jgi:N-acetylneuraminate synthase
MNYKKPRLIAEAGCNHKGDMEIARELIKIAAIFCKADVIKFQKRNNKELLTEEQYNAPHPNPINSYGETYGEHREFLEFTADQHKQLKIWCEEYDIEYSTSVWDLTSAKEIAELEPKMIKIPSACNNHFVMLEWLCLNYSGEIHLSFGMTTHEEEEAIISLFEKHGRNQDLIIYSCTSGYPVPFSDVALLEISRLKDMYSERVKEVGFSGHHLGIAVDSAAYTLGASTIERHYTLDRTWKGTDHSASLEPMAVKQLKTDLNALHQALDFKEKEILDIEKVQRDKLKYREK